MTRACICFSSSRVSFCGARTRFGFLPPFFLVVLISIRSSLLTHRYHSVHRESSVISRYQAEAALESISRRSSRYIASEQARQIRQPSLSPSSVVRQRAP